MVYLCGACSITQMGETLMVVESDKADMDVESFDEGFLAAITLPEGSSAPVGSTVAIVVSSKEDIPKVQEALKWSTTQESPLSSSSSSTEQSEKQREVKVAPDLSSTTAPGGGGGGDGASSEAFARHKTQLASWVSPSVDQDVKDQLPEGLTANNLQEEFLHRLSRGGSLPDKAKEFLGVGEGKGGTKRGREGDEKHEEGLRLKKAMLERLNLRVPPPHTLLVSDSPPPYLPRAMA